MKDNFGNDSSLNQTSTTPEPFVYKLQKLKEDSSLHPYVMRSFKATQVLCDVRNLKYIMQTDRKAFEKYCKPYIYDSTK